MTIKFEDILPAQLVDVQRLIQKVYPDPRVLITADLIKYFVKALPAEVQQSMFGDFVEVMLDDTTIVPSDSAARYYLAKATHSRAGVHAFEATLPMVRVMLPATGHEDISTDFGTVYAGDHKLRSVEEINTHYMGALDFAVHHAQLLTPARWLGARFGAIATYMLYDEHGNYRAYCLEPGMATGEAVMLFLSPEGKTILRPSWYEPTPFSTATQLYGGSHVMKGDEPTQLNVNVYKDRAAASTNNEHVTISVIYSPVTASPETLRVFPSMLTVQAALRVALIAETLGKQVMPFQSVLAEAGKKLVWIREPRV